jgi:hypothetical protein
MPRVMAGVVVTGFDGGPLQGLTLNQVIDKMRGPPGSRVELTITRNDQALPANITVVREAIRLRPLLSVQVKEGSLVIEAIGGRQVSECQPPRPLNVVPISDTEFFVPGRYHTRIVFTKDAAGKASGAVLNPGRWEQKGVRIE